MSLTLVCDEAQTLDILRRGGGAHRLRDLTDAVYLELPLGEVFGYQLRVPVAAYAERKEAVDRLWAEVATIAWAGKGGPQYGDSSEQNARIDRLEQLHEHRREADDWALLFIKWYLDEVLRAGRSARQRPLVNEFALYWGFYPDNPFPFDFAIFEESKIEQILVPARLSGSVSSRKRGQELERFIGFFVRTVEPQGYARSGRTDEIVAVHDPQRRIRLEPTLKRRIELARMEVEALDHLVFLSIFGDFYRGWLMVAMAFLAPVAIAPEIAATGAITTGVGAAAEAEAAAAVAAQLGPRAMLLFMDVAPPLFELALELAKLQGKKGPLTPGETINLLFTGLGAVPSARLGYFMTGVAILSPLEAFTDLMDWLGESLASLQPKAAAAQAGLELTSFEEGTTVIIDLDD